MASYEAAERVMGPLSAAAVSIANWATSGGETGMKRFARSFLAAIAPLGLLECNATDGTDPPEEDPSPLTKVEIPPNWHLDQINSLYRDRERLASGDGAAYAASMRRSLDEANAYVTELLNSHMRAFYLQRLREDGHAFPRDPDMAMEYVAGIIASHAQVATQEVEGDMERIETTLPPVGRRVIGLDRGR